VAAGFVALQVICPETNVGDMIFRAVRGYNSVHFYIEHPSDRAKMRLECRSHSLDVGCGQLLTAEMVLGQAPYWE
jgi:hypothetical protein